MRQEKGRTISAEFLNEISGKLARALSFSTDAGLESGSNRSGRTIKVAVPRKIWAKVTSGSNPYAWSEVQPAALGTWAVSPNGNAGTTTVNPAYEVNGKSVPANSIVQLEHGDGREWLFEWIAKGGACSVSLVVSAKCNAAAVSGTLIELLDATGTTVIGSCTGSSCTFSVSGTTGYKVRVSKAGYCTKTYSIAALGCAGPYAYTAQIWPSSYVVNFHVWADAAGLAPHTCPVVGATVTIGGDASASGTTDATGLASFTLTSPCTTLTQNLTYTVTPPTGYGMDPIGPISFSEDPCSPTDLDVVLEPSAGHIRELGSGRFLPDTLAYSDDYGSCSVTSGGTNYSTCGITGVWVGLYTYSSSHVVDDQSCPSGSTLHTKNHTADVTVNITVTLDAASCGDRTFTVRREVWTSCAALCLIGDYSTAEGQLTTDTNGVGIFAKKGPWVGYTAFMQGCLYPQSALVPITSSTFSLTTSTPSYYSLAGFSDACADGVSRIVPETAVTSVITGSI